MRPKDEDRMASSVDPNQSDLALQFAQPCLSKNLPDVPKFSEQTV